MSMKKMIAIIISTLFVFSITAYADTIKDIVGTIKQVNLDKDPKTIVVQDDNGKETKLLLGTMNELWINKYVKIGDYKYIQYREHKKTIKRIMPRNKANQNVAEPEPKLIYHYCPVNS